MLFSLQICIIRYCPLRFFVTNIYYGKSIKFLKLHTIAPVYIVIVLLRIDDFVVWKFLDITKLYCIAKCTHTAINMYVCKYVLYT